MPPAHPPGLNGPEDDTQWRAAGERIQTLLDASASGGVAARERAEQLVREVTDLYGAGLQRILAMATSADPGLADRLAADDLVASLLLVHGLHPYDIERRVADALDSVRPYLGSHGGDVHLLGVDPGPDGDYVVRLQFAGSCKSCPSSAVTLELAVQDAVRAAAPEIGSIEVISAPQAEPGVIPPDSLLGRVHANGHKASWQPVPELAELAPGEVGGFSVAGTVVLACRVGADVGGDVGGDVGDNVGDNVYAYADRCPNCTGSLAGTHLDGAVLACPCCGTGYDVVHAGAAVTGDRDGHLEPIPVLVRGGVLSMAVPEEVA